MSEKIVDVTGTYTSWGIGGGYHGHTLQIGDQEISDMVREKLGIEWEDVAPDPKGAVDGIVNARWRLRVQIEVVEVDDE